MNRLAGISNDGRRRAKREQKRISLRQEVCAKPKDRVENKVCSTGEHVMEAVLLRQS